MPLYFYIDKDVYMQHKDIPDGQIHEPKGISTATEDSVYVANGTGSGTWVKVIDRAYGELYTSAKTVSVAVANTYYPVQGLTGGLSDSVTYDTILGTATATKTGVYRFEFNTVATISGTTKQDVTWKYTINGVLSGRSLTSSYGFSGDKLVSAAQALVSLQAGDVLGLQVTCDSIRDVIISDLSFIIQKIS